MFFWLYSSPNHACQSGDWHAVFLSLFPSPLLFSHCTNFFFFSRVGGAIVCLRLVYEEHWFTQWGLACWYKEGGEIWMNLPHPNPSPPYSKILPSSFFLSKCSSATSSHTFPLVCMHVCQRECICAKSEGRPTLARGSFLWPGQCVSRRAAGVSGASSSFQLHSLTLGPLHRVFATSHCLVIFEILQDKKPVLSFKHLFKMTGCVCGTCRGDGAEEMGEKTTCIQNWEELWEWVSWLGWRCEVLDYVVMVSACLPF